MTDSKKTIEFWYITNVTNRSISIQSLPSLPTLKPKQRINILDYVSLSSATSSVMLRNLIERGSLRSEEYYHDHEGLDVLTGGSDSIADDLHTHSIASHQDLLDLQGGKENEYYHLKEDNYAFVKDIYTFKDGIDRVFDGLSSDVTSNILNQIVDNYTDNNNGNDIGKVTYEYPLYNDSNIIKLLYDSDYFSLNNDNELTLNLSEISIVNSINEKTGTVVLNTDDIEEGENNLYFTEQRVLDLISEIGNGVDLIFCDPLKRINNTIHLDISQIDHNLLKNYLPNEHIDWTSTDKNINTTGNITAGYFYGDGSNLTGIDTAMNLSELEDVNISPSDNDVLVYDGTEEEWVSRQLKGDEITLGDSCYEEWDDGLLMWDNDTIVSCALEDVNEILSYLAPPPAPDLNDIGKVSTNGVSGRLSFDDSNPIGEDTYESVNGIGDISGVNVDEQFLHNLNYRYGIINSSTNITGRINDSVSAHEYSYPQYAFGNADQGELILELNGDEERVINLETEGSVNDAETGFYNLLIATPVEFAGGDVFEQFKYRTGNFRVHSSDMRLGWNYVRIIHRINGDDTETNYLDWVVDGNENATSYSNEDLYDLNMTGYKYLSGVEYYTGGTAKFDSTVSNAYRNTYSMDDITFSVTNLSSPGTENLYPPGSEGNELKDYEIEDKNVTINANRLLDEYIRCRVYAPRTVQWDPSGEFQYIYNILLDNVNSSSTDDSLEDFNDESRRLESDSDFDYIALTPNWNSEKSIDNNGDSGYNDGLLVYNGGLYYPNSSDVVNDGDFASIDNGPSDNVDYSGDNCTGNRYYYRWFKRDDEEDYTSQFSMNIDGNGNFVNEDSSSFSGDDIRISIKLPSQTGWMDCTKAFYTDQWEDGDGCRDGNVQGFDVWWNLDVGEKRTSETDHRVYMRITVPEDWEGYINNIQWRWDTQ